MLTPFLLMKSVGGMGLTTQDVGIIYGTFVDFIDYRRNHWRVISKDGLGKWMLPMILAMHLPILGFALAHFHPSSVYYIYATVMAEFGYGFGFAAFMMYLIYVADGESKPHITHCYWIYGIRNDASRNGKWIHTRIFRLRNFFIWVFLATIPGLILSRFLIFPYDFGKKSETSSSDYEVLDV
jgi:PAT family beta-lactamase induction signal transducer AmpG